MESSSDTIGGVDIRKGVNEQVVSNEPVRPTKLLRIDSEYWKNYDFQQITFSGTLAEVLSGRVGPGEISGGEIDHNFNSIIRQLRDQHMECKTSLSISPGGHFLLQVNPTVGTADSVNNFFAQPPKGKKVL